MRCHSKPNKVKRCKSHARPMSEVWGIHHYMLVLLLVEALPCWLLLCWRLCWVKHLQPRKAVGPGAVPQAGMDIHTTTHTQSQTNIVVHVKRHSLCIRMHTHWHADIYIYWCVELCVSDQVLLLAEFSPCFLDTQTEPTDWALHRMGRTAPRFTRKTSAIHVTHSLILFK